MTLPQPVLIGVDVGSTNTSGGLVTLDGKVLLAIETKTHRDGPGTAFDILLELVSDLLAQAGDRGCRVEGIGIGLPGIVDIEGGTMRKGIHRVPELAGAPLVELIRARSGVPVFIDNDVNALGLGEWTWGVGRGAGSMVMLALGTGVGGAVILDGHLVRGKSGYGGELGHVSVNLDGRPCALRHPGLPFRLRGRLRHGDGVRPPHPRRRGGEVRRDELPRGAHGRRDRFSCGRRRKRGRASRDHGGLTRRSVPLSAGSPTGSIPTSS